MKRVTLIFAVLLSSFYALAQDMKALYQIYLNVMPENDRVQQPEESFKSFYVHTLDTNKKFVSPANVLQQNLLPIQSKIHVQGKMTYVQIFKRTYQYDVENINGKLVHHVKIFFRYAKPADITLFKQRLAEAEQIWNDSKPLMDFDYGFKFDLTENPNEAHFKVNVLNSTRGPYDMNWGRDWDGLTVAHEVGHMMGLGDEYETLSGRSDCLEHSIMCDNYTGYLMEHHYYFILRRLVYK